MSILYNNNIYYIQLLCLQFSIYRYKVIIKHNILHKTFVIHHYLYNLFNNLINLKPISTVDSTHYNY